MFTTSYARAQADVCMPINVAKTIARELTTCDSIKELYSITLTELTLAQEKGSRTDTLVGNLNNQIANLNQQVENLTTRSELYISRYDKLNTVHQKYLTTTRVQKVVNKFINGAGLLVIGFLTYRLIIR